MDLYELTGQPTNLKVVLSAILRELPDFARVGGPYLHSPYVKDYNTKREKYVLIKFYVSNLFVT